ncbi:hypothetical protein FQ192_06805 [Pseudomonas sp. ANT_J12]|nr:hypothetical protein FQ192_06805 [Pseudomonas sp. ANT_J12]
MRIRVKLQNFAKAAILAIAQQNCSIDDACPCTSANGPGSSRVTRQRDGAVAEHVQALICEYLC